MANERHRKKQPYFSIIWGSISMLLCIVAVFFFPPTHRFYLAGVPLPILPLFFSLLFLGILGITQFFFHTPKHGIFLGSLCIIYLLFQLNSLTHPFFLLLLVALFVALELLFAPQKKIHEGNE